MSNLSFNEFKESDSIALRREKLNELLRFTTELESQLSQFYELFAFIKSTYNSKPYFFDSVSSMVDCKFLQNNFTCICLIKDNDGSYIQYYKITNSETGTPDGETIFNIAHNPDLKAVKIPDLFGIEELIQRVNNLEALSGGEE